MFTATLSLGTGHFAFHQTGHLVFSITTARMFPKISARPVLSPLLPSSPLSLVNTPCVRLSTRVKCTQNVKLSVSVSNNLNRRCSPTYFPKRKKCQWRWVEVRVKWRVTHTQETRVCIPFKTKLHQSFPRPNQVGFVPKLDQRSQLFLG